MGCTSVLCEASMGLRAVGKDWLGVACAVVQNKLTDGAQGSGQACGVAIVVSRPVWNQHVRINTVEVSCGLGGVTGSVRPYPK